MMQRGLPHVGLDPGTLPVRSVLGSGSAVASDVGGIAIHTRSTIHSCPAQRRGSKPFSPFRHRSALAGSKEGAWELLVRYHCFCRLPPLLFLG